MVGVSGHWPINWLMALLLQPLNIFILGLGCGFLIPLFYRLSKPLTVAAFIVALCGITVISGASLWAVYHGAAAFEIHTAGSVPPFSINLRFGLAEGFFAFSVNVMALLGAWHLRDRLGPNYAALLLFLLLVMGINGMIMTRDLFNLFVFLEIVSIATYGLLGLERTPDALAASFKYIMATVLASSFFLLGTVLLYHVTGTLNIDELIAGRAAITGVIGTTAILLILSCLIIELKPFPANGWGLDVYETAPSGLAALVSGAVSAGVFFALLKLLPLFENQLWIIAISGGVTFLLSNLAGLKQTNVQRLLGYSSIAQMGLITLSLALLREQGAQDVMALVVGGLFINHLFAKAGLFWLAGVVRSKDLQGWSKITKQPSVVLVFAGLLVAISGLPPFPGFWAKWELIMRLAAGAHWGWITLILAGSLFEAAYMFRWFKLATGTARADLHVKIADIFPALAALAALFVCGYLAARSAGAGSLWLFLPLCAGVFVFLLDHLPGRVKCAVMLALVALGGFWLLGDISGLNRLFAVLLLAGSLVITSASFYREDRRPGYFPLMTVLVLSIVALFRASTTLEFFFCWEMITLSSYFLVALGSHARSQALQFLLFSLVSAFLIVAGFGAAYAVNDTNILSAFLSGGPQSALAFVLLAAGFLIKTGSIGVHVWMPATHAAVDSDLSAMLSGVITKVAAFGLFMTTYLAIRSGLDFGWGIEPAHVLGWIGLLTTVAGAVMALHQPDIKRMLAYSSMSQLGYIVLAIAVMSHLGWVTALYLVANHLMVKGILFLAVAGVILRTGTRRFGETGGLARQMPLTFMTTLVALISMSGLPPLAGFGGKWLLLSALMDKQWYWLVVLGVLATFIGLLYMVKLAYLVFLGNPKAKLADVREAPIALLVPQFLLVCAILVLSFFPKLFMDPVSAAIDPYFASTLVWQGQSLELIYSSWNALPVMAVATGITAILFAISFVLYKTGRGRSNRSGVARFYGYYQAWLAPYVRPQAALFWDRVALSVTAAADSVRRVYTGDGQTYALYILYYVFAVYAASFYIKF